MFNLSFINSYFLYGLLLASVPIIIHLVNKKKAVALKFPTIRFILASNKRVSRRFKLRQIILLLLRTLSVLFLVFLFARPLVSSEETMVDYTSMARSTVVIVDNSSSMLYQDGATTFFRSAYLSAESILVGKKNIDNAALIETCDNEGQESVKLNFNKEELLNELRGIKVSYKKNKILKNFKRAVEALKPSSSPIKEIFFISDMQKAGWGDESVLSESIKKEIKENNINVYLVDIAYEKKIKNIGITSVAVLKESKGKISVLNTFSRIKNFSDDAFDNVLMKCYIGDDESVKGFVTLKPFEMIEKNLFLPIEESGIIKGNMKLTSDNFTPDDIRYFSLKSYRTVRTLVVDGDPTAKLYSSETFYLNLGLNPLKDVYSKIESRIVTYDEFKKEDLANYDALFLCNVESVEQAKVNELKLFVQKGGGLLFSLGDKVDPQEYNKIFGDLLPQKLRDVFTEKEEGAEKPFEYIDIKDYSHPVLAPFEGADSGDLSMAKFYKYFVLQPSVESKSNIILEFSNGNPCVVERRYHNGNVLLFTSTVDRDYNDLCIYPTYLPLMQQMTLYAAKALGKEAYTELIVGDTAEFSVEKDVSDVTIVDSDENLFYKKTKKLKEIAKVTFDETYIPGFYNIYNGKITSDKIEGMEPIMTFAVNVDPEESDFTKIDEKVLEQIFSENFGYIKKGGDIKDVKLKYLRGKEVWMNLLLFLIVFLLLESVISSSWRKHKEIKSAKWKEEGYKRI